MDKKLDRSRLEYRQTRVYSTQTLKREASKQLNLESKGVLPVVPLTIDAPRCLNNNRCVFVLTFLSFYITVERFNSHPFFLSRGGGGG